MEPTKNNAQAPEQGENDNEKEESEGKKKKKKGIDLKKIVTSFTEFFTPDDNLV